MDKLYTNLKRHMEKLCLECGPRQCGSKGERMAADYIESEFKKLGYETVREEYPVYGWNCTEFSLWNVTQNREVPCATAGYFSNSVDIEDKLVWLRGYDMNRLDDINIKGKLCFVEAKITNVSDVMNTVAELLDSHGAAGAIFISTGHTDYAPSTKLPRSPLMKSMAVATVSQMGAYDIYKNRNDVYRLVVKSEKFDHVSCNVIARRSGGTKKGVIGAHYDTAPFIQGASDDATGTATVIELARIFKDRYPDWSFDFCAFSAEEYIVDDCPEGSKDYVRWHKHEDIKWYLNLDSMGECLSDKVLELWHSDRLPKIDAEVVRTREAYVLAGDDKAFAQADIPTVWLKYLGAFALLHTHMDNLDGIDMERLAEQGEEYVKVFETLAESDMYK